MSSYERFQRDTFEIEAAVIEADERNRSPHTPLDEVRRSWLLRPTIRRVQRRINLGCTVVTQKVFLWTLATFLAVAVLVGLPTIAKTVPGHHHQQPLRPDNYSVALPQALKFFHAQRSGKLPRDNNISWRGDSCLRDGYDGLPQTKDLVGGYFDGGDTVKFHFPGSFAMTILSWSVIEYTSKYEAAGQLDHVKEVIMWGVNYFLKCFDDGVETIGEIVSQVGVRGNTTIPNDHYCWMRPEDIDYFRLVSRCTHCSDLVADMASASIVFKDDMGYSKKLVHGARVLFDFSRSSPGRYSAHGSDAELFYNSTNYWDEYIWGATWLYYATGDSSYLSLATDPDVAKHAGVFSGGPDNGVFNWDHKLLGASHSFATLFGPRYPYEELLRTYHDQIGRAMCSYLPFFKSFNRTKGGLIQLNHGRPGNLKDVVNAAFLSTLYSDYIAASGAACWYCGPELYTIDALRGFAESQMQYILGKNPKNMSYVVGFGSHFPFHVYHRAASIPKNKIKYGCEEGKVCRDTPNPNPNTIVGALVSGPDRFDDFHDVRDNYSYTEPTLVGNTGLVAAFVALSGGNSIGIDLQGMFSAIPLMFPDSPPPPAPWTP